MNDNIGVGLIVGLVTASSLYVWNSKNFTKVQKIFLLIFLIFPPLQWVSILLVLVYNKFQIENSSKATTAKKNIDSEINLYSAKTNLYELKEKGIISKDEFNSKIEQIRKTEYDIINSIEYKQLKSLLDSGILTKEEFNNKVKLIGLENRPKNDIVIEEEKQTENKSSFVAYFIIGFFLIFAVIIFALNNSKINNYDDTVIPADDLLVDSTYINNNYVNSNYQEPITIKKFVYVVIKVKTPKLSTFEIGGYTDYSTGMYKPVENICSTDWEESYYSTEIIEVDDYNEDEKNRLLDKTENDIESKIYYTNLNYEVSVRNNCRDESKKEELLKNKSKITDRQIFDFDTYSQASLSKQTNKNINNDLE